MATLVLLQQQECLCVHKLGSEPVLSFRTFIFWAKNTLVKFEQLVADTGSNGFLLLLLFYFMLRIKPKALCMHDKFSITELYSQSLEVF